MFVPRAQHAQEELTEERHVMAALPQGAAGKPATEDAIKGCDARAQDAAPLFQVSQRRGRRLDSEGPIREALRQKILHFPRLGLARTAHRGRGSRGCLPT